MRRLRNPKDLTARQDQVLKFIVKQMRKDGRPPTIREIGSFMGVGSTNAVRGVLSALEKKGHIRRRSYLSRGIELTKVSRQSPDISRIPIVGRVAAGTPLLAVENLEGELAIDKDFVKTDDGFALRVRGESMIEAGINDGDLVITRPDLQVEQGSIVVAMIGDEATVKYCYVDGDNVRLEPANPHFETINIKADDPEFRIAGRVIGLFRKY